MEGVAGQSPFDQGEFGRNFGRQGRPFLSRGIDVNRLRLERPGIEYRAAGLAFLGAHLAIGVLW
jgi:hypothetical protein